MGARRTVAATQAEEPAGSVDSRALPATGRCATQWPRALSKGRTAINELIKTECDSLNAIPHNNRSEQLCIAILKVWF